MVGGVHDGHQCRQLRRHVLPPVANGSLHANSIFVQVDQFVQIGDEVVPHLLCHLRAHLCGIAIDGLSATKDEVRLELLGSTAKDIAGRERVAGCGTSVGDENSAVGSVIEALANDFTRCRGTHGQYCDRSAVGVLDLQRQLEGVVIFRIENRRQCAAIDGSVFFHSFAGDPFRIGHLLNADYNIKWHDECSLLQ